MKIKIFKRLKTRFEKIDILNILILLTINQKYNKTYLTIY